MVNTKKILFDFDNFYYDFTPNLTLLFVFIVTLHVTKV